jgi:hypothetical protein
MNPSSAPLLSHAVSTYKAFRNLFVAYPLTFFVSVLLLALSAVFGATATAQNPAPNPETWMHDLGPRIGYLKLNQVVLPGTHDAGTAILYPGKLIAENGPQNLWDFQDGVDQFFKNSLCTIGLNIELLGLCTAVGDQIDGAIAGIVDPGFIEPWSHAQDTTIAEQLNGGIRFLDIRPCPWPTPQTYTEIDVCHGLFGEPIQEVLNDVAAFSATHKDEIIILSMSHESDDGIMSAPGANSALADSIVNTLGSMLIIPNATIPGWPLAGPNSTLSELWHQDGRIIVLYDDDAYNDLKTSGDNNYFLFWAAENYYNPWPNLDGTWAGPSSDPKLNGRIYFDPKMARTSTLTPWNLLPAVKQNLKCGNYPESFTTNCQSVGTSDSWEAAANAQAGLYPLFGLQTQPTDKPDIVEGDLLDDILANPLVEGAIGACDAFSFEHTCSHGIDALRTKEGFAFPFPKNNPLPTSLHALDEDANAVILQNIKPWMLANPALRQNLNIVLADYFEQTPNFIPDMIELNTPPQSTLSIGVPQYGCPTNCFVTSHTPFTISATDSNFGVESINYTYEGPTLVVVSPPAVSGAVAEFDIAAPPPAVDGPYTVFYWATNNAGLWGDTTISAAVTLDNTPPVITIVQPAAVSYPHWAKLTLNYSANDGTGSGVASVTATIDGMSTVGGQVLASGKAINLENLSLGTHVFTVTATDHVGNTSTSSVTFSLITTPVDCSVVAPEVLVNGQKEFTITATVTPDPPASVFPTGKVQIWDAAFNVHIIPDPTLINGVASMTVELAPTPTTQWIMSIYPGDTNFKGCQSQFAPARWVF